MKHHRLSRFFIITILMALSGLGICGCRSSSHDDADNSRHWGTATLIETDDAGNADNPQVAFDADGNAVAVWQQSDGTRINIWANHYTAASKSWGTAALIETDNLGSAGNPQIAIDAAGNAVAVWQQYDGTHTHVWTNRYTAGAGWGTAALIETDTAGDAYEPQLAIDGNGNVVAVWVQDNGRTSIWTNRYTASTGHWGTAALLETDDSGFAHGPQVVIDADGDATVVWYQFVGYPYNIWTNRYTAGTNSWSGASRVESNTAGNAVYPRIAVDADGNCVAVWQQYDDAANRYDAWANRYAAATGLWGTPELIESDNAGLALSPEVAMNADGNAVAVWHQSDGTRTNIWTNRYTAGTGWGTAAMIETDNAGDATLPRIAIDADGNTIVVWTQSDGTRTNIQSSRYTAGTGWGTPETIETDNTGNAGNPHIAIDASGNAVAVWQQSDGSRTNIWSNMYR